MDHVILNHGQVTWTTPELAPPLLTTTPHQREDVSALDRFNVHRCPTRRVFSGSGLELVTRKATVRYLYHSATAAIFRQSNVESNKEILFPTPRHRDNELILVLCLCLHYCSRKALPTMHPCVVSHRLGLLHRSLNVCAYHSTPFTAEWSVRKTSVAWSTLDAEPNVSATHGAMKEVCGQQNEMKLSLLTSHAFVCKTRWSDSSLETPWRADAEELRYAPRHWSCTGYYGMGRYCISLSSSTHYRYFKQPALHLRGVGASCPSLPTGLGQSHISTG
ncbi:uncharacterized protein TNCV_4683601 [Trichonephila clavipes]|nr:uncharacterized protein TNCV_4683601 [Trichonephila clavipes]